MRRAWRSLVHVFALVTVTVPAWSQDANRAEAAARFEEGTKAFDAGDFRRAAEAFGSAYHLAPNTDALWNAARAWQRSGEAARAATLYARYLRDAPPNASDRPAATSQLALLSPKLARIEVHGDDLKDLQVDDVPCEDRVLYVSRGAHVVSATVRGTSMRKDQQVEAGDVVSVVFEAPAGPPALVGPLPSTSPVHPPPMVQEPLSEVATSTRKGWSPWVFVTGAALTGVAVGLTVASGVDTDNALTTFEKNGSQANLTNGLDKQLRTNILLGASIGLGAATAVVGIWLVGWRSGSQKVEVGIEPARAAVRWCF
jgi:tetratricopeptide (TPR) repeat protein